MKDTEKFTSSLIEEIYRHISMSIINRLRELNIKHDPDEERKRRFKSFTSTQQANAEGKTITTYYYNDGSIDGLELLTATISNSSSIVSLSGGSFNFNLEITYGKREE
jgi:hypothetical protein